MEMATVAKPEEAVRIPQQERSRQRVAALLQSAAEVFVEKGYDAATMTEIAARAKASIGSLYQFFPTKELLATELRRQYGAALLINLSHLEAAAIETPEALADAFIQNFLDFIEQHPALMVIVEAQPAATEHRNNMRQRLRELIMQVLVSKAPQLTPDRVRIIASVIQQILKAAVAITQETPQADRPLALIDLKTMLGMYLRTELGPLRQTAAFNEIPDNEQAKGGEDDGIQRQQQTARRVAPFPNPFLHG